MSTKELMPDYPIKEEEKQKEGKPKPLEIFHSLSPKCNFIILERGILYFSYDTLIAYYDKATNTLHLNIHKYSNTTDGHLSRIKYIFTSVNLLNTRLMEHEIDRFEVLMRAINILPFRLEDYKRNCESLTK